MAQLCWGRRKLWSSSCEPGPVGGEALGCGCPGGRSTPTFPGSVQADRAEWLSPRHHLLTLHFASPEQVRSSRGGLPMSDTSGTAAEGWAVAGGSHSAAGSSPSPQASLGYLVSFEMTSPSWEGVHD